MSDMTILPEDESHFIAHSPELLITQEEVFHVIKKELAKHERTGELRISVKCKVVVGRSGLKRLFPGEKKSYWANRSGRSIPSHIVTGRRKPTKRLCFWGFWRDSGTFIVTTYYPGKPAPRELHDPKITSEELRESVRFWACHAIVVEEPDF